MLQLLFLYDIITSVIIMVILITGASHTGKTLLSQKMLEKYKYPCLSTDHLKMGLIRSGYTSLTPLSDDKSLTEYLWPVVREIIKTVVENKQNLIVEGCYIPSDWDMDFQEEYLENISCNCLVMSEKYIRNNFYSIVKYADVAECRIDDDCSVENVLRDNAKFAEFAKKDRVNCILIEDKYDVNIIMQKINL